MYREIVTDQKELRVQCEPVGTFGIGIQLLCKDLVETMGAHKSAVGLAAPQIGHNVRVMVIKPEIRKGFRPQAPIVMINPIYTVGDERIASLESCLSEPGVNRRVMRWKSVSVWYDTPKGDRKERWCVGSDAVKVQHEVDHLDGKLLVDHDEVRMEA